jgi:EAL domain-containing protein (putative c-di-GMP-specific phosphodiesterase class I)/GGDEF domain-containing protein
LAVLAAAGLIAVASAGLGARSLPPAPGLMLVGLGALILLFNLGRRAQAGPLAVAPRAGAAPSPAQGAPEGLVSPNDRPAGDRQLEALAERGRLLTAMATDIGRGCGGRVVGMIRLNDFDRLAGFDPFAAESALAQLAQRLRAAARPQHLVAQIERDAFGVWFRQDDVQGALAEFRALAYVASQDVAAAGQIIAPTIDAGFAVYPEDGEDAGRLLLRASGGFDGAGGHAGKPALATRPTVEAARQRFVLEQGLAKAIAEDQLSMVFQPVIDAGQPRLIGAEALLRWTHPMLGAIPPSQFIPIVESIGLSDSYGLWVLNAACREARRWRDEGLTGIKIAVNLSARQLLDPDLRTKVERTLQRHGLEPTELELELTETAAMADAERTVQLFRELRAMGVSLAIDDFGAGYSSLSYLKNLPFDKLKIDREFVTNIRQRRENRAICRALIELGRGLGLQVLAEGVETADEVAVLRRLGCRIFQGYFFARPLSGPDFLAAAQRGAWPAAPVGTAHQDHRQPPTVSAA